MHIYLLKYIRRGRSIFASHSLIIGVNLSISYQSKYAIMITGNTDVAAATSTVGSNSKGSRHFLMSKPSGLKWQASASASKSSDAAASSNVMELSHVGLEQETDVFAATSTVESNGNGFRRLMSQPSGLKWQASASASKSLDAAASSNVTELSHVGLEQEIDADAATSSSIWKWYEYPWATIRTNDPIFRSMASFVVGESESKKLDSLSLTELLCTALTVFDVRSLQLILVKLGGSNFNRTKDELIGCAVMLLLNRDSSEMTNPKCERKIDR